MEPHRTVSPEEFATLIEKALQPEPNKTVVETPEEDTKEIERLLGLPAGSFGKSYITVDGAPVVCSNCGRQASFLDIINDGAKLHGTDFVKDVVEGKHGSVHNPNPPRPHKCFKCGVQSPFPTRHYNGKLYCTYYCPY